MVHRPLLKTPGVGVASGCGVCERGTSDVGVPRGLGVRVSGMTAVEVVAGAGVSVAAGPEVGAAAPPHASPMAARFKASPHPASRRNHCPSCMVIGRGSFGFGEGRVLRSQGDEQHDDRGNQRENPGVVVDGAVAAQVFDYDLGRQEGRGDPDQATEAEDQADGGGLSALCPRRPIPRPE